uniref:Uncharacterized protein n=1 Tax=Meloidogyne enterolobii TaxID=390850 RepID=A0A6V7W0F7_MELEN|nr:unnamed protein product [Meloidogyne enterolobii]
MLYIHRLSVFESHDSFNEDNLKSTTTHSDFGGIFSDKLLGIISIIFCLILSLVLLFIICQFRQIKNYLTQRNASNQLRTPLQPVEVVEKRRENEETARHLLSI